MTRYASYKFLQSACTCDAADTFYRGTLRWGIGGVIHESCLPTETYGPSTRFFSQARQNRSLGQRVTSSIENVLDHRNKRYKLFYKNYANYIYSQSQYRYILLKNKTDAILIDILDFRFLYSLIYMYTSLLRNQEFNIKDVVHYFLRRRVETNFIRWCLCIFANCDFAVIKTGGFAGGRFRSVRSRALHSSTAIDDAIFI